ncbi:Disease resistance-like protein DSC1 [Citrus sinensis]|uniref:Disease resistance-like protein DSC1 n=1 Tax=Citrus sinensis TaxID=2711 RepID=A0ACB8MX31_CITSI|nr:Disease resistance-like protein DSC1 [Citrus sinensis]
MASSSFPPTATVPQVKYDVFLSFRGEDTRDNFTSHLYAALCRKKIETFIDNQLIRGEDISPSLLDAIERSKISVVIFSKGYASSGWCLEELVKILECKDKYGQIVIPVFYHVEPSNVRNQTGIFGDAFSMFEERFVGREDKLRTWRIALREAANISGFDSNTVRPESVLIEELVKDVLKRLNDIFPSDCKERLVGVESSIRVIESLLSTGSKEVYSLGIWGIGGIGKTTIASAIFSKISTDFDGSYFIQNVREESEKSGGLAHLRQTLLSAILEDGNVSIVCRNIGLNFRSKRLSRKKVLIVFDDVSTSEQMEFLIGDKGWLMPGSRLVITARDKQVLRNCGVDTIYEVKELFDDDALMLFSRYAFGKNHPNADYMELSNKIIKYAKGVPLAIKVLGRFLCGRRIQDWESAMNKMKRIPHVDIQRVLKVSYDGLDDEEQNIFLDIACFFKGEDKDCVIRFLDGCGFSAEIGISVLVDKCLMIISNNTIMMHDLLQEMGREIVRQESIKDPGKRSRLWHHEDIYNVLTKNMGTESIEGISLDMSEVEDIHLNARSFTNMHKLRFFKLYSSHYGENVNKVHNFRGLESTELRYLQWHGCPLKSLSSKIHPENLVSLEMPHSSIKQLWKGVQRLVNLKHLNLSHSEHLTKIPDLSLATNLESLNLQGCTSLLETHSSIQYLNKLIVLNLGHCRSLTSLSTSTHLESLKKLILSGCSNLMSFPELSCNIEELSLDGTAIQELPSSIERLSSLILLNLGNCSRLEGLPSKICKLKSLERLNLSGCSNLQRLPNELGNLEALKELKAEGIAIREVPSSIVCLKNLGRLSFESFKGHEQMGLLLPISFGLTSLTYLRLTDCSITELPECLGQLSSLRILFLDKNNFERIPESIICLSHLYWLRISYCERLKSLPELPCDLSDIEAHCCSSLEALSGLSILFTQTSWNSQCFDFVNCFKLDKNELKEIIKDAQRKMQLEATAWWEELEKQHCEVPRGMICFPGSELPEWFMFQSMGASAIFKLPLDCFSYNFVGFALCAVVAFRDHHDGGGSFHVCCESILKTEDGLFQVTDGRMTGWFDGSPGPRYIGSDHVFLGFDFNMFSDGLDEYYCSDEVFIQFYLEDRRCVDFCEVTKCGIHLLYARDFADSTEDSVWNFSSDEEEELPLLLPTPPKRLKYSVKQSPLVPFVSGSFL